MDDMFIARIEINKKAFIFDANMYDNSMCLTKNAMKDFSDFYGIKIPNHSTLKDVIDFFHNYSKSQKFDSFVMYFCKRFGD
jgi:hypothetical protein